MTIKIYFDFISQPSRAVLLFCDLNKIPYQGVDTRLNRFDVL